MGEVGESGLIHQLGKLAYLWYRKFESCPLRHTILLKKFKFFPILSLADSSGFLIGHLILIELSFQDKVFSLFTSLY